MHHIYFYLFMMDCNTEVRSCLCLLISLLNLILVRIQHLNTVLIRLPAEKQPILTDLHYYNFELT